MVHVLVAGAPTLGPRVTATLGVNATSPVAASISLTAKVMPAQAVPARPVPGEVRKTPGSSKLLGQNPRGTVPQDGMWRVCWRETLSVLFGLVDTLMIVMLTAT